jgi:hypothetical protein
MPFLPFTLLRPRGIGTRVSCRSRATEIVRTSLELCRDQKDFCFSIDSVWALQAVVERTKGAQDLVSALQSDGRLAVGAAWAGAEWATHAVCVLRDLQIGSQALGVMNIAARTLVLRSGMVPVQSSLLQVAGIDRVVVTEGGCAEAGQPIVDLQTHGDLGIRFVSDEAVVQRDAEKEIDNTDDPVPLGEELWCPTAALLSDLVVKADDANIDAAFVTWDACAATVPESDEQDSYYWEAALPGEFADLSRATGALMRAERILAMATLLGEGAGVADELEMLWKRHLEDLAGRYTGSGDQVKREELKRSCDGVVEIARLLTERAESTVASQVDAGEGPGGIVSLVVFNPSTRERSDTVEADIVYYGENRATSFDRYEFYKLVDAAGESVPAEEVSGKQVETAEIRLRFIARDVPALGYKTYYFVPKPRDASPGQMMGIQAPGAMMPDFPEPAFAIEDVDERVSSAKRGLRIGRSFTAGPFVVDVDEITGRIDLLTRDKRVLLEGLRIEGLEDRLDSPPGQFQPTGRLLPHTVTRVDLAESGEVSALLNLAGTIGQSSAEIDLRLYEQLPVVDIRVSLAWRDHHPAMIQLSGSLGEWLGAGRCDVSLGTVDRQEVTWDRGIRSMTATDGKDQLTVSSGRSRLYIQDQDLRCSLLLSTPDPSSYAYNKVWLPYPDRLTYDFRIQLGEASGVPPMVDPSEDLSCQVVYDRSEPRSRPASRGTLEVESESVQVASVRPVEGDVEVCAYEAMGAPGRAVYRSDCVDAGDEVDLQGSVRGVVGADVDFSQGEIKTIRFSASGNKTE